MYYVGIDIGSSSIQIAAIDQEKNLVYVMENIPPHFGTPLKMLPNIWHNLTTNLDDKIISTSFTGIGAQHFNKVFPDLLFDYESVTIPKGVFFIRTKRILCLSYWS